MAPLIKQTVVSATASEVWRAWSTTDGLRAFFCPRARIDLRPGGDFEILFDPSQPYGQQGSEGCVVVGFEPLMQLSFTWNFPPTLASIRNQHTIVTVEFLPTSANVTTVTLTQRGFRDDGEWPAGRAYFDRAWGIVLEQLRLHFETQSADPPPA